MRNYLILFLTILLLLAWIGDQILVREIGSSLESQSHERLEIAAGTLESFIESNIHSGDRQQQATVLKQFYSSHKNKFELIDESDQLWFDSEAGIVAEQDQSNKPEVISTKQAKTGLTIRDQRLFLSRMLTGPHLNGLLRVSEPYQPITELQFIARRAVWGFAILAMLLGSALMFIFARRSLSPLDEFAAVARMIGVGKYDTVPALHGRRDNWAVLADAYRHMQEELVKREISILDNSSRLQAVLSSMIEGVLAIDRKGRVMLANGAACDMLQMAHSDIFGRDFLEIFRVPELSNAIEKTQKEKTFSQCEFQTRELPRKIISARVSVLTDSRDSKVPGIAIVLHDVTDLRQLETLRRDFVANVSHELKTPLASIKAYAETLKLGAINDSQKNVSFVEHIEAQADLLNEQIQDLLQLARVESGQKNWEIAPISINEISQSCISQFASEANSRKIKVTLQSTDEELYAKADKDGVRTILTNLVSNALHYTGEGGTVEICITNLKAFVKIEVVDDGIGISTDHHARIFERFYRVDKARSREHGGTGLGLAIVKHLCQAFGGSVELESKLGEGSRFIVKLPNAKR